LFFEVNENNSSINILIGSKKFVEGWNSWRVSNMVLINMGKGEGPQIIQLFGRGVRLKGKNFSLKREENPDYKLKVLQTLFIFGLNADYINAFLRAISNEEVDYEEVAIRLNRPEKREDGIYTTKDGFDYPVKLRFKEDILETIKIDLRPKITVAHGLKVGAAETVTDKPVEVPEEYFELIDWQYVRSEIINFKITRGFYNLIVDADTLRRIAKSNKYRLFLSEMDGIGIENNNGKLKIKSFDGLRKFQEIILAVLKDYVQKFYVSMAESVGSGN